MEIIQVNIIGIDSLYQIHIIELDLTTNCFPLNFKYFLKSKYFLGHLKQIQLFLRITENYKVPNVYPYLFDN